MVFNATSNNRSVISWRSVLLVEKTAVTIDLSQVNNKLYRILLSLEIQEFTITGLAPLHVMHVPKKDVHFQLLITFYVLCVRVGGDCSLC
jgi:hypothetical protein